MSVKTKLVFNDVHGPWHDPIRLELTLKTAESIGKYLDEIIINGDLLDFYNVNSHGPKSPEIQTTLEDELSWGLEFLSTLRVRFPNVKITYIFGNHEWRLDRFIIQNCPSFFNLVKLESQLQLKHLNIDFIPYNSTYQIEKTNLHIQHSPPSYGVNGARTSLLKKHNASFIWGCTHRRQHAMITGFDGTEYHAFFNGWLGSTGLTQEHKNVFKYCKEHEEWQGGFALIDVINSFHFHVNQYGFLGDSICIAGKLITI